MSIRKILQALLLLIAIVLGVGVGNADALSTSVKLLLFPYTGEVRILNDNPDPFSFTFYSLKSSSGALDGTNGVWTSIADTYDVSGNQFIDSSDEWIELANDPMELSEGAFLNTSGTLPAFRSVSLGKIWDPNAVPGGHDVVAQILLPNGMDAMVSVDRAIDGDYLRGDDVVNELDYSIWKAYFGSTSAYFADGNIDGIVDAADYTVWRDNFGLSLPGSGNGASGAVGGGLSAVAVPEPTALILAIAAVGWVLFRARRLKSGTS